MSERIRARGSRGLLLTGRVLIAFLGVVVLVLGATYWSIEHKAQQALADNTVDAGLTGDNTTGVTATGTTTTTAPNGDVTSILVYPAENILVIGGDSRDGEGNDIDSVDDSSGRTATDTMIVLHISGDRQHIYAMSLPRDMWAPNVTCYSFDRSAGTYGAPVAANSLSRQHLNSFYGVGGPKCLVDAVENLTQLTIDRYVQIDFAGFQSMVDALGGVTVNACQPIIDTHLGTVLATAGEQRIDGAQALTLARARHVVSDNGLSDLARVRRQQVLLAAILREVSADGTLLDPVKLNTFFTAFSAHTVTDNVDLTTLIDLAKSVGNLSASRITFFTVPTVADSHDTSGRGSLLIDTASAGPILDAFRTDQPAPITVRTDATGGATTPAGALSTTGSTSGTAPVAADTSTTTTTAKSSTAPSTPSGLHGPAGAVSAAAPVIGTSTLCL